MNIHILTVGKIEDRHYKALCDMYVKRISHYLPVSTDYIKQAKISNSSAKEILKKESGNLLKKISNQDYVIALDIQGKQFSSEKMAQLFNNLAMRGLKKITFIIGGPLGLGEEILSRADLKLSLSQMTFAHELAFVVLSEQIYRALSILRGEQYHK